MSIYVYSGDVGPQGPPGQSDEETMYSKRLDVVTDSLMYRGEAVPGASETAAVWRIRRISIAIDGDISEQWVGSAAFAYCWSDRASLEYT